MTFTGSDTKTRILDAAWALVERQGRADITMREVAQVVGISRQALYLHFPNRATLLLAMVQHFDDTHSDPAARERRRALPPVEGLEAALRWWLGYLPRVLPVARALEAASMVGADGAQAWLDRMRLLHDSFEYYVTRLAEHGMLAEGWSVRHATDWVWARINPSVWRHLVQERGWKPRKLVDHLVHSILTDVVDPTQLRQHRHRTGGETQPAARRRVDKAVARPAGPARPRRS